MDEYDNELKDLLTCRLDQVVVADQPQLLAGLVTDVRRVRTRQGNDMMFVTLDDRTARLELTLFPEADSHWVSWLKEGVVVIVQAEVTWNSHREERRIRATEVMNMNQARAHFVEHVIIEPPLGAGATQDSAKLFLQELRRFMASSEVVPAQQRLPIQLWYRTDAAAAMIRIHEQFSIAMTDENLHRLRHWLGEDQVKLAYEASAKRMH
jgi:DNA polymerase-3 subunit alpha